MGRASRLPPGPFEMLYALLRILIAPGEVDVALNVVGVMLDCRDIARLTVFRQQRGMTPVSEVFFYLISLGAPEPEMEKELITCAL